MKKVILLFFLFSWLLSYKSFSSLIEKRDSTKQINLIVKTDVLLPLVGLASKEPCFSFSIEKLFKNRHSIQVTNINAFSKSDQLSTSGTEYISKGNVYVFGLEYKFFTSQKKQFSGYYVGLFGGYVHYHGISTETDKFYSSSYTSKENKTEQVIGEGIMNGYQFYVKKHLTFDFVLGGGIGKGIFNGNNGGKTSNNYLPVFMPRIGATIGYKF